MAELKDRLAAARTARGLTQRQVAEEADISLSLVSLLERGERTDLRVSAAAELARVLGCSVSWLLTGEGKAPEGAAA